jgi:hypothetical protein
MKTLQTVMMVAITLGSISFALAQNAPTSKEPVSPNNINKGTEPGSQSGAESQKAATGKRVQVAGKNKYCRETSANGPLDCVYASMNACESQNKSGNLKCVANPNLGTTGSNK